MKLVFASSVLTEVKKSYRRRRKFHVVPRSVAALKFIKNVASEVKVQTPAHIQYIIFLHHIYF